MTDWSGWFLVPIVGMVLDPWLGSQVLIAVHCILQESCLQNDAAYTS